MAMQRSRVVDIEVDPEFNIHTSYHNDFFLLKTRVTVNGENTQVKSVKAGSYEEPTLVYGSTISTTLRSIANTISPILKKFGVYHMDTFYYEQSPLFHVVFSSESCLTKFLLEIEGIRSSVQAALFSVLLESDSSRNLVVEVHPELFLVSPNRQKTKGADLHLINAGNSSTFAALWKNSKLFDFGSLYQEVADPPRVTDHPKWLKDAVPGQPVTFTVRATGTEPLNYQWQWKPAGDEQGGSEEWQLCDTESSDGTTLTIPCVQKLNEGSYQCVISNCAGSQTSTAAKLRIADPPRVTTMHPMAVENAVPGQAVTFTVHTTGTEPMNYQWWWKPAGSDELGRKEEWQLCDVECSDGTTLRIPNVEKLNEGSYQCIISNCAGIQVSTEAKLSVADRPRVTAHPEGLKDAVPGQPVTFSIQAEGTGPLSYEWQHKPRGGSEEVCDVERFPRADSSTLTIPSAQKSDEGSYHCTVSNCAGSETSDSATLTVAEPPNVTAHPEELKDTVPGKPVSFTVHATGAEPLSFQWQWKPIGKEDGREEWQNLSSSGSVQGTDTPTLTFSSSKSCSEGLYRCTVTNCVGAVQSAHVDHITGRITDLRDLLNEMSTVTQWYLLGIYLGIDLPTLATVKADYDNTKERRSHTLIQWWNHVTPTWSAVVKALVGIGREKLACQLAAKYEVSLPDRVDNTPLEKLINAVRQNEDAVPQFVEVCRHGDDLQQMGARLAEIEQLLKFLRDSQLRLNEDATNIMNKRTELSEQVEKLSQNRDSTDTKLQRNKRDCVLLSEMQKVHDEEKCQLLQEIIDDKKREIKRLQEELKRKEHHLERTQQEAKALQEKLSKVQEELKVIHEDAKKLQEEKEELTRSYNSEKEEISRSVYILTSDREGMKQQLITTKEELEYKSQQIETRDVCIRNLTAEVEALSQSLHEKETAAAQLQSELQSCQNVTSTSQQLTLTTEIAELRQKLNETEHIKQQAVLEREAAVQEVEAKQKSEVQLHKRLADPPKITSHTQELNCAVPGKPVAFTVQATGTEPLGYQWQWKPGEGTRKEEWQQCDAERFQDACSPNLIISSVQKLNEGSYRCVVSNCAGIQISEPAKLSIADPPKITTHPQKFNNAVPGKPVTFTVRATGIQPLNYKWQWKPAGREGSRRKEWQLCDLERFPGADSCTLTIPSAQKPNEGSFRCAISNCAGGQTSNSADLVVADLPRITGHPEELKKVAPDSCVTFTVQATGTEPMSYQWQQKAGWNEWQQCDAERFQDASSPKLIISSVKKPNEGHYRCVVCNCAGKDTSKPAKLSVADPPRISRPRHPQDLKDIVQGESVTFTVRAIGESLTYRWQWKPAREESSSEEWQLCDVGRFPGADSYTFTIPSVEKSDEGSFRCVISNCAGSQTSKPSKLTVADPPRITSHPQQANDAVPGRPIEFTVQATGTEPLTYEWQWKPAGEESSSEEWQRFPGADSPKLTISSVEKSNEGSFRCAISNCAGCQTSNTANLVVADPPRITSHPQQLNDAVPGKPVTFTVQATGTQPLTYEWQWKPAGGGNRSRRFSGANSSILTIPRVQKSNEGSYCCTVSNHVDSQTSKPAILSVADPDPPRISSLSKDAAADIPTIATTGVRTKESEARSPSGLQLPLTLKWRRRRDMPCRMESPQSVRLGEDVFVGGGDTDSPSDDQYPEHTVYRYHPQTDQWVRLPRYKCMSFAMAILMNKLTLVGGYDTSTLPNKVTTNQIAVWERNKWMSWEWTHPYPPMPTSRHSPAVAAYNRWLVVAGGMKLGRDPLATVEVLDTTSRQWLSTSPLPVKCCNMTSAIVHQELFLIGGSLTTEALAVSLPDITRSSVHTTSTNTSDSVQWRSIPAPPLKSSAAIAVSGSVLAIGGYVNESKYNTTTAIHVYQPATNSWEKVGDLPSPRSACSSTLLPSGEILVAGGRDSKGCTSRVYAAAL